MVVTSSVDGHFIGGHFIGGHFIDGHFIGGHFICWWPLHLVHSLQSTALEAV